MNNSPSAFFLPAQFSPAPQARKGSSWTQPGRAAPLRARCGDGAGPATRTRLCRGPSTARATQHSPRSHSRPPGQLLSSHNPVFSREAPGRCSRGTGNHCALSRGHRCVQLRSRTAWPLLLHSGPVASVAPLRPWAAAASSHSLRRAALPMPELCQRSKPREGLETALLRLKNLKRLFQPSLWAPEGLQP